MAQIHLQDFLNYKSISNLSSNPAQTCLAYSVSSMNEESNDYHFEIWIQNGQRSKKVVRVKHRCEFIFEDNDHLLIRYHKSKKEEKKTKEGYSLYYRYSLVTNKLTFAYEFPFPASILEVYDQQLLLQATLTPQDHELYLNKTLDRKAFYKNKKQQANYVEIEQLPFYFNGRGFTANQYNQLFLYSLTDQTIQPFMAPQENIAILGTSFDRNRIYFTKQVETVVQLAKPLYQLDMLTKQTTLLYPKNDLILSRVIEIKGRIYCFANNQQRTGLNQNPDLYELQDGEMKLVLPYGLSLGNSIGADVRYGGNKLDILTEDAYYFVTTVEDHSELCCLREDASITTLFKAKGSLDGITLYQQQFYAVALYKQALQEVYCLDLAKQRLLKRSAFNYRVLKEKITITPKPLHVKKDNITIQGFVMLPKDYNPNQSYPAILNIHGGPKTVYGSVYYHEMQVWAHLGFVVFFCNPRGSDGKGDQFSNIFGKYGTIDFEDIMDFTDAVLEKYRGIDESRLFVTGGSYGGFMTNWIVGHTHRFKAAVTQRSISNWISFYGTSDIGFYFAKDQTHGHPTDNMETLWQQSPLKYAANIQTPLLFIHSDEDYRCPIEQALQLYAVIKEKGVETRLVWFKGENHELSRGGKPQARLKRLQEITNWFLHYNQQ